MPKGCWGERRAWTAQDVETLLDGYRLGLSLKKIGTRLNRTPGAVDNKLTQTGVARGWSDRTGMMMAVPLPAPRLRGAVR